MVLIETILWVSIGFLSCIAIVLIFLTGLDSCLNSFWLWHSLVTRLSSDVSLDVSLASLKPKYLTAIEIKTLKFEFWASLGNSNFWEEE
jgi:hypothetical protein